MVGGSGLVGKATCRRAVQRGIEVVSLSRGGAPSTNVQPGDEGWMRRVDWRQGSGMEDEVVRAVLQVICSLTQPQATSALPCLIQLRAGQHQQYSSAPFMTH